MIGGLPAYSLLVGLGLLAGIGYIIWQNRTGKPGPQHQSPALTIVSAALVFGLLGAKLPTLLTRPTLRELLINKSIVGGLLGGMIGVYLVKRIWHIQARMGNVIAPAAALGIAIGRLGCFCNGCCAGIAWTWGFDFGDGIIRLPTQLFESAFHLGAFAALHLLRRRVSQPGILFKAYVLVYFAFRFLLEFIRVNPVIWLGLTMYQLLSLGGIAWMSLLLLRSRRKLRTVSPATSS